MWNYEKIKTVAYLHSNNIIIVWLQEQGSKSTGTVRSWFQVYGGA